MSGVSERPRALVSSCGRGNSDDVFVEARNSGAAASAAFRGLDPASRDQARLDGHGTAIGRSIAEALSEADRQSQTDPMERSFGLRCLSPSAGPPGFGIKKIEVPCWP